MTVKLSKELEQFIHNAVSAGLYASEDDVVRDALTRLRQAIPGPDAGVTGGTRRAGRSRAESAPITPEELNRRLFAAGLVSRLPDPSEDIDDEDDPPIAIRGEPLSDTIIRERR